MEAVVGAVCLSRLGIGAKLHELAKQGEAVWGHIPYVGQPLKVDLYIAVLGVHFIGLMDGLADDLTTFGMDDRLAFGNCLCIFMHIY
jgi:hypothetical protein